MARGGMKMGRATGGKSPNATNKGYKGSGPNSGFVVTPMSSTSKKGFKGK